MMLHHRLFNSRYDVLCSIERVVETLYTECISNPPPLYRKESETYSFRVIKRCKDDSQYSCFVCGLDDNCFDQLRILDPQSFHIIRQKWFDLRHESPKFFPSKSTNFAHNCTIVYLLEAQVKLKLFNDFIDFLFNPWAMAKNDSFIKWHQLLTKRVIGWRLRFLNPGKKSHVSHSFCV